MRRTKANRALTFVMAVALLIGSIHGVGAKEQSKAYDAPELTLTQGVTDYDLTEGITYDSEKYTLSVTDTGNFDINVAGDYEISYALTEKESSVNVIENVENAESAGITESTGTASDAETIETTDTMATVEDTDQTLEGDDTNTGDTQEKQVITFTRTVHVVAASVDEVPVYVARELVLVQGEDDYDLTDEIVYDDVNYTLDVVELGGFDISKISSYEVTYSLTPVTTEGTQENGQDDTQDNQAITFKRIVQVVPADEKVGQIAYEIHDLYLEQGQDDYDLTEDIIYDKDKYELKIEDLGDFDIDIAGEYEVTYSLTLTGENSSLKKDNNTLADSKSLLNGNNGSKVYFVRTVFVIENAPIALYAADNSIYTIALGQALWNDGNQTFSYSNAVVESNVPDAKISMMTITVSSGKIETLDDTTLSDLNQMSGTWIYDNAKTLEEVQQHIRDIKFTKGPDMIISISLNGNHTSDNFNNLPSGSCFTQWNENGHYYLFIPNNPAISWHTAYNLAKTYVLGGMKGYLATIQSDEEIKYLNNITTTQGWIGGTTLVASGSDNSARARFNDPDSISSAQHADVNGWVGDGSTRIQPYFYWACGPETGSSLTSPPFYEGHSTLGGVNRANMLYSHFTSDQLGLGGWECCLQTSITNGGINDIPEGNLLQSSLDTQGIFVEFGGYEEVGKQDPGNLDTAKKSWKLL